MRESGMILAQVLQTLKKETMVGRSPKDMSRIAVRELKALGGEPAFLGFYGYPDIICVSVNSQVQHSIPSNIPFNTGDVVNYDFGVRYRGMITDAGLTICVGDKPSSDVKRLIEGTKMALEAGIAVVKDGCRVGDISSAIEKTLKRYRLGIVKDLVGHGVGHELHEDPNIPNYGHSGRGPVLKSGMTIAIEPITTLGRSEIVQLHDGWTLITADGSWSAQFEDTVLVTDKGCEILTRC